MSFAVCGILVKKGYTEFSDNKLIATIGTDTLLFLTPLVLGILGLIHTFNLSPAASYALIGISGATALTDILFISTMIIVNKLKQQADELPSEVISVE